MNMKTVEIYTTQTCPYCIRAKSLLKKKGATFKEIDVGANPGLRVAMTERAAGRRSVPQIFINSVHVGGCDDLHALEESGKLDALLK
jgi:glutaredoxin 3